MLLLLAASSSLLPAWLTGPGFVWRISLPGADDGSSGSQPSLVSLLLTLSAPVLLGASLCPALLVGAPSLPVN